MSESREEIEPIEVWGEREGLKSIIQCHIENSDNPTRYILVSIREWAKRKIIKSTPQPESKSVEELVEECRKIFYTEHEGLNSNNITDGAIRLIVNHILSQTKRSEGATATTPEAERVVEALKEISALIEYLVMNGLDYRALTTSLDNIKSTLEGR